MLKYDGTLNIAVGFGAEAKIWKNKKIEWSKLVGKLGEENKTNETIKEFLAASKTDQSRIKDVGGYVGGYLRNGRRKPQNVVHRQLMTLDIDFAHMFFWEDFQLQFDNAAVIHGTHKHTEESPRFRLIIPLSREATPDEYVAVSRQIAGTLGIDLFDNTTFEPNRLMFWPSVPKDVEYYFQSQDGPWLDVDSVLATYPDWKDSSLWPTASSRLKEVKDATSKQEDPELKKGVIGAFCKAYSISEAIEIFLPDTYIPAALEDRFTYTKGSAAAGLIVYDDKFAYSHHGTDPCGGKLCNSFDLVRIHKFGHLDNNDDDPDSGKKQKSTSAMEDFARNDLEVKKVIATETIQNAKYDFNEDLEDEDTEGMDLESDLDQPEVEMYPEEAIEWMKDLEVDAKGNYLSSSTNLNLLFANDRRLKKLFRRNEFDRKKYVFGNLPWRKIKKPEPIRNVDYAGIRNYIESIYGITGTLKIDDSLSLEFEKNRFHPIQEYLNKLEWDGVSRIDNLLIDYFGAEDTPYTREAVRKFLVGAVARVFEPGCKFDLVLVLVSKEQGTGKSSFLKALGQKWFSDSFSTVSGKEAFEQLQGSWIIEIAELSGLRKADIEPIKHFISKQEDQYRPAYERDPECFPRQCVFVATTNEDTFLRDPSGNRRFMPVDLHNVPILENEKLMGVITSSEWVDSIWSEAVFMYRHGETLYLSSEATGIAKQEQILHSMVDERKGIVEHYLDTLLPDNWDELDIHQRRGYFDDEIAQKGIVERDYVCIAEIWCECLGKSKEDMDRYKTREVNDILRGLQNWEQSKSTRNFKIYGKQKYYSRRLD